MKTDVPESKGTSIGPRTAGSSLLVLTGIFAALVFVSGVLGLVGLLQLRSVAVPTPSWLQMAAAFLGLFTNSVAPWVSAQPDVPLTLELAAFVAPLTTAYAFVASAAVILSERWRLIRARLVTRHSIVIGGGRRGVLVSRSLARAGERVVLVDTAASSERVAASLLRRTIPLSGDPVDDTVLRRAGIDRGTELFAVSDDTEMNASIIISARRLRTRAEPFTCFALVGDSDLHIALEARQLSMPSAPNFRVSLIDRNQLVARGLLGSTSRHAEDTILIIGEGGLARALAFAVVLRRAEHRQAAQRIDGADARVIVAGPDADDVVGAVRASPVGRLAGTEGLSSTNHPLVELSSTEIFGDVLETSSRALVFVCAGRDEDSLRLAFAVLREAKDVAMEVVVCVETGSGFAGAFAADGVRIFDDVQGAIRVIASSDYLGDARAIREAATTERIARAFHSTYLDHMRATPDAARDPRNVVPWEDLPIRLRDSNRAQAWDIGEKLRLLGCVIMPIVGTADGYRLTTEDVELLAQAEHRRWSANASRSGLVYGPERSDRTHPDLVPWEALSESAREKDRIFVRDLPAILTRQGYEIVKIPS